MPFSVCLHIMKQITKLSEFTLQVMEYEISKVISTVQDSTCLTLQIKKILQEISGKYFRKAKLATLYQHYLIITN